MHTCNQALRTLSVIATFFVAGIVTARPANCDEVQSQKQPRSIDPTKFLRDFCVDCHTQDDPSGERVLESLDFTDSHFDNQLKVQEIIDQLNLETMPPEDGDQPSDKQRLAAIKAYTGLLAKMRQQTTSTDRQTVLRRLSRREYRNTVGDLLKIDMTMFDPTIDFPGDNLAGHFDNVGEALITSGHLLERYLDAADQCVEKALSVNEKPVSKEWNFDGNFFQQPELATGHRKAFKNRFICLYDHPNNDKPEGAYGFVSQFSSGVPVDGQYEIRVLAKAMHRDSPYGKKAVQIDLEEPFRMGLRSGDPVIGDLYRSQPIQPLLGEKVIADDKFRWYTFDVHLNRGLVPRFTFENGIHNVRRSFTHVYREHKEILPQSIRKEKGIFNQRIAIIQQGRMPHIRIDKVSIRGPIDFTWPTPSQQLLTNGTELAESKIDTLISQFASRAFRRPATDAEIDGLKKFYHSRRMDGKSIKQAYKDTLKAALCSPAFLYFQQPSHFQKPQPSGNQERLSNHALAERLAYFLTSSMPDETLRKLADSGELSNRDTLRREAQRLLASEASNKFITDFLDSWLNLRSLGSMPPDPEEFWFFYAAGLQQEMKRETHLFLRDLIDRDASIVEMLSSEYSFLNRDLAKLYGVTDKVSAETASDFRKVHFDDPNRGGLLGQASIMTVSANGIETSPVVRGVWMLENILGTPTPPPPDDVPTIEPDTRGAKTIRDQLVKHRENQTCFQCHRKIDPPGFALECFDAIGQQRKFYDSNRKQRVDTSGELPGGEKFTGLADFKKLLLKRKQFFVRTFTQRLLTHALGRPIEVLDRGDIDAIVATVKAEHYPTAMLIEAIVLSDVFRR